MPLLFNALKKHTLLVSFGNMHEQPQECLQHNKHLRAQQLFSMLGHVRRKLRAQAVSNKLLVGKELTSSRANVHMVYAKHNSSASSYPGKPGILGTAGC